MDPNSEDSANDPTETARSRLPVDPMRRALLLGAGALTTGFGLFGGPRDGAAIAAVPAASGIDLSCRVTASRLDELVAAAYPLFNKPVVLPDFDAATFGARHDVDLHRIVTETVLPRTGEKVKVSGLLALPVGVAGPLPVVGWQHGTILSFDQVPSNLLKLADPRYETTDAADSLETLFNVHRFAARGRAVIAADYLGKGPFRDGRGEAYVVKEVTVQTCLDVLAAGKAAMRALGHEPGKLFLHGWSQGAINTQWLHQSLRAQGQAIAATAVASPFNDIDEAWRFWTGAETFALPAGVTSYPAFPAWISLCMIIVLGSYETHYGIDGLMAAAIKPKHLDLAKRYWQTYTLSEADIASVPTAADLLVDGFFEGFTSDGGSALLRRFASNCSSSWNYDAPIRFDYGLADEAIHPRMVYRALMEGGSMTTGVPIAGASHRGTFLAGLYGDANTLAGKENVPTWFDGEL